MAARSAVVAAAAAMLAACTPAAAPAPEGSRVRQDVPVPEGSPVPEAAPVIVSLNPCTDAILAEIAPGRLAAISHYSHDPAGSSMPPELAARFPAVSGNAEEVAALRPDLVVASVFLPPATEQAFARMGLRVVKTGTIATAADSIAQIRELAALAGEVEAGERLVARIEDSLRAARPAEGARPLPALVWQSGGLVPGEQTLISDLLVRSGFANWSAGRGLGQGALLPLEQVLADPPPLILIAGAGGEENRKLAHPALAALDGTAQALFDPQLLYCGGPTIPRALERLTQIRSEVAG